MKKILGLLVLGAFLAGSAAGYAETTNTALSGKSDAYWAGTKEKKHKKHHHKKKPTTAASTTTEKK